MLSLIIFLSLKILTRITPHTRASVKISMIKKEEKAVRKPKKAKKTQEIRMLRGMPKLQEKVIVKIK